MLLGVSVGVGIAGFAFALCFRFCGGFRVIWLQDSMAVLANEADWDAGDVDSLPCPEIDGAVVVLFHDIEQNGFSRMLVIMRLHISWYRSRVG